MLANYAEVYRLQQFKVKEVYGNKSILLPQYPIHIPKSWDNLTNTVNYLLLTNNALYTTKIFLNRGRWNKKRIILLY